MKRYRKLLTIVSILALAVVAVGVVAACVQGEASQHGQGGVIPQPDVTVRAYPSYARDIQPVFNQFCTSCHSAQQAPNGLRLDSYEGVMKGTRFGSVIVPGQQAMSPLLSLIKHETDPSIWMPYHQQQLSRNRIQNIENWIRYGARNN